jgi:hypothetical protein
LRNDLVELRGAAHAPRSGSDIGLVPAEPFDATGAAIMIAIAALATLAAVEGLRRRDLTA